MRRARGEGRESRGGAAAAHDNKQRRRGAGGSRGLGRSRAGHHGSGSPRPVGRHPRPRLKSIDLASRPERGEAQGPQGNVVRTLRFFRRELGPRELGLWGPVWTQKGGHLPGVREVRFSLHTVPIVLVWAIGPHELPLPGCRGLWILRTLETLGNRVRDFRGCGLGKEQRPRVSLSSRYHTAAFPYSVEEKCRRSRGPAALLLNERRRMTESRVEHEFLSSPGPPDSDSARLCLLWQGQ